MPWTSGTVANFTGFLQALKNFSAGDRYDETIGTGNGVQLLFNFTLLHTPVAKGQVRLKFKVGTTEYQVFDNGQGQWIHDKISSSSLNYATGVGSITFAEPVANLYDMVCTYCVGKNGGEEGRDWLLLHERNTRDNVGGEAFPGLQLKELWLKNSGVSYEESIYVGLRECQYLAGNFYNINFNVDYEFGIPPDDNADWNFNGPKTGKTTYNAVSENWTDHPSIALNDDQLAYWIFSNKNRIAGVVRVAGTIYETFYLGAGLRLASPARYPFPLLAIGSIYGNLSYTDVSGYHAYIVNPYGDAFWVWGLDGRFVSLSSQKQVAPRQTNFAATGNITKTTNGKIIPFPTFVREYDGSSYSLTQQLEGVYAILDMSVQSEDIVDVEGQDCLVVQNIFRTTYADYLILEMK